MIKLFKVEGSSLYPLIKEDEVLLCFKLFSFNTIKVNDFVLFKDKTRGFMVKKVTSISDKGYFVKGETPLSYDSRNFGALKKEELLYKVVYKF